ncbi:hypothetical protein [Streptomyces radiopugnans]|uniref:hypothetical protein n=1 Tax=Streptomyces radiopugnans TaxID=403935 RepID=UPI003F1CD04E
MAYLNLLGADFLAAVALVTATAEQQHYERRLPGAVSPMHERARGRRPTEGRTVECREPRWPGHGALGRRTPDITVTVPGPGDVPQLGVLVSGP